jgi:tetraprenyl-beta-curcumene synthase
MVDDGVWSGRAVLATMRREVLPLVATELERWRGVADRLRDPAVRERALDSLRAKRFHCEGGAVLALCAPAGRLRRRVVRAIVAVQTLSDFLDSWTDRPPADRASTDGEVLVWHGAFAAAAAGLAAPAGDGDPARAYAITLARAAGRELAGLPGLGRARPALIALALRYGVMQAMKHGPPQRRAAALSAWHERLAARRPVADRLPWPAAGAAAGSTLALFRLYAWAAAPDGATPRRLVRRYAPWACALHILLDAVVDEREDAAADDLNWWRALGGARAARRLLGKIARTARRRLDDDPLGRVLVAGLVATYLSDPKARRVSLATRLALWRVAGPRAWAFAWALGRLRRRGELAPRPAQIGRTAATPERARLAR